MCYHHLKLCCGQVQDVARDDFWHIDYQAEKEIPNVRIKDGDYLATTCIYNSDKKNNVTVGGIAAQEEMCVGFLSCESFKLYFFCLKSE